MESLVGADDDSSVTLPQVEGAESRRQVSPVLLLAGDGPAAGAPRGPRVVRLPIRLEIGRARGESPSLGDGRLEVPDKLLSRVHLRIERTPGGCDAEDAGSLNGTYVDGQRLSAQRRLSDGSVLVFGGQAAVFRRATDEALAAIEEDLAAPLGPVATTSPALAQTLWRLRRLARSGAELLITGETGAGKEVYARAVHAASGRTGRFVAINCASIPAELAESELFGYARGAHSTATDAKPGLIQSADGGTLFLDEIGDMPPRLQAKLLRFLQDREVTPLGATTGRRVDVQVLAATNNAALLGAGGELRSDLTARLGARALVIPPLRDRIEDLGVLVNHFLKGTAVTELEPAALHALCLHSWPRNVRELQKVVAEAVAVGEGASVLRLAHLPETVADVMERSPRPADAPAKRPSPTRAELESMLREHKGNVAQVARVLDRQWAVVWRWLVKHDLDPEKYRG